MEEEYQVIFYELADGDRPAEEFLNSLNIKMRNRILLILTVLQERGNTLREPYSKHLEDGIFEIRGKVGSDISRILYFFFDGRRIVLTNGFIKKSKKTPQRELDKAKKYRADYLERNGD